MKSFTFIAKKKKARKTSKAQSLTFIAKKKKARKTREAQSLTFLAKKKKAGKTRKARVTTWVGGTNRGKISDFPLIKEIISTIVIYCNTIFSQHNLKSGQKIKEGFFYSLESNELVAMHMFNFYLSTILIFHGMKFMVILQKLEEILVEQKFTNATVLDLDSLFQNLIDLIKRQEIDSDYSPDYIVLVSKVNEKDLIDAKQLFIEQLTALVLKHEQENQLETANDIKVPDTGDHLIEGPDVNTVLHLNEDSENIAISYYNNRAVLLTTKDYIERPLKDNDGVVYKCLKADSSIDPTNIDKKNALLNLRVLGLAITGYCLLSEIKTIVNKAPSPSQCYTVEDTGEVLNSVVSWHILNDRTPNALSASHCQAGQGGPLYTIKIANRPDNPVEEDDLTKYENFEMMTPDEKKEELEFYKNYVQKMKDEVVRSERNLIILQKYPGTVITPSDTNKETRKLTIPDFENIIRGNNEIIAKLSSYILYMESFMVKKNYKASTLFAPGKIRW